MFKRVARYTVKEDMKDFPVVIILGARQVGKTTLVKQIFDDRENELFLDLEKDSDRNRLSDPELFLTSLTHKTVIIDKAQAMPDIFRILRPIVDEHQRPGQFILLGSW